LLCLHDFFSLRGKTKDLAEKGAGRFFMRQHPILSKHNDYIIFFGLHQPKKAARILCKTASMLVAAGKKLTSEA